MGQAAPGGGAPNHRGGEPNRPHNIPLSRQFSRRGPGKDKTRTKPLRKFDTPPTPLPSSREARALEKLTLPDANTHQASQPSPANPGLPLTCTLTKLTQIQSAQKISSCSNLTLPFPQISIPHPRSGKPVPASRANFPAGPSTPCLDLVIITSRPGAPGGALRTKRGIT